MSQDLPSSSYPIELAELTYGRPVRIAMPGLTTKRRALFLVVVLLCFSIVCFFSPSTTSELMKVLLMLGSIGLLLQSSFRLISPSVIELSEAGIKFQNVEADSVSGYHGNDLYQWSLLHWANLIRDPLKTLLPRNNTTALRFSFVFYGDITVPFESLSENDRRSLIAAMRMFAKPECLSEEIQKLALQNESSQLLGITPTFTELWQNDLLNHCTATTFPTLSPGDTLQDKRYSIQQLLDCGGFAAVYLAVDTAFSESSKRPRNRTVILKETVVSDNFEEEEREQLLTMLTRESTMLARLEHPNINRIFDHFVEVQRHYLVLEFVPGVSLRKSVLREGKQSEAQVLAWSTQIANVLQYLHSATPPIIHRDVTPDNVIIGREKAVLVDFGSARELIGEATGTVIGKHAYIPPEQFRGRATETSDVYALARSAFFALTGEDAEPLTQIHPRPKIDCSLALASLLEECTAMDDTRRPTSSTMATRLDELSKQAHTHET